MKRSKKNFIILFLIMMLYIIHSLFFSFWPKFMKKEENFCPGTEANRSKHLRENAELQNEGNTLIDRIYPDFHQCSTPKPSEGFEQRGRFWVIKNYIKALKEFRCDETITYTTHGEYYFLDNLVFLAERWQGPISVAVYVPGSDFDEAVKAITYLRNCVSQNVKDFVTFHLYFESEHFFLNIRKFSDFRTNCSVGFSFSEPKTSYRKTKGLLYPVNVGRNIARTNVATYFVFASDIELNPSVNVIPEFLKMIERRDYSSSLKKRVFVLPNFEVKEDKKVPETKPELLAMLKMKDAIWFHKNLCEACHLPPGSEKWNITKIKPGLSVTEIGKRIKSHKKWEPFYIGTNDEPFFDERLSYEGTGDKMTQAYAMCLLGYEYHILDNAFLVHKPGIKHRGLSIFNDRVVKQFDLMFNEIAEEYEAFYGAREECTVM